MPSRIKKRSLPVEVQTRFQACDPASADYVKAVVDYFCQSFMIAERQVLQVYEELLHLGYWLRGFAPQNILEIGTAGATFFVLSRFASGKKAAIDIRDLRP